MQSYLCGCKDLERSFIFCVTHALSDKRVEIQQFWWQKYTLTEWTNYKKDLVVGLKLEESDSEPHPCVFGGCTNVVVYDDEPYCFDHSSDSGSTIPGYSYKTSRA